MKKRALALGLVLALLLPVLMACATPKGDMPSADNTPAAGDAAQAPQGSTATPAPAGARELRMSLPVPEGTATYEQAVAAKEYIEKNTNGELTVTIFHSNQLGDWTQVFDELMMGSIDMAISNVPDTYDPILGISSFPYVAYDYENARKFFSPSSFLIKTVDESLGKLGIRFFGFSMSGFDGIGTKNEAKNAAESNADKDALIRVPSLDGVKYSIERLGFRTSTIPYTDTYSSLQTGVVNGWIGAPPYQHYLGFRDVENYYYAYNSLAEIFNIMMSKTVWDSLTESQQKVVQEALEQAAAKSIDDAEREDKEYLELLRKEGMTVVEFTPEQLKTFAQDIRDNVWPKFEGQFGKEFLDELKASMAE